jgi:hypothetical protein
MSQPDTADRPETTPAKRMPEYRGAPLDPERGPGLGCFWIQIVLLVVLLIATPLSVILVAPPWFSAALLILTLVLLLFVGQTTIFLLRLVAVDRRSRRRPMGTHARRTVGQLEDEARATTEAAPDREGGDAGPPVAEQTKDDEPGAEE